MITSDMLKPVRVRKTHICFCCSVDIQPKSEAFVLSYLDNLNWKTKYYCKKCGDQLKEAS